MNQYTYHKIITHAGAFHADEILAIATIYKFYQKIPVERLSYIQQKHLDDPNCLILDIGNCYAVQQGNFDHHQSAELAATNLLVLRHFCKDISLVEILTRQLYQYVSMVDTGKIIEQKRETSYQTPSFNQIIKSFNSLKDGFKLALQFSLTTLDAYVAAAKKEIQSLELWNTLSFEAGIAIQHNEEIIINWKILAEKDNIHFLITPNTRGGYQIISRDAERFPIKKITQEQQVFLHQAKFLAVYISFEAALQHARDMMKQ